MKKTSPRLKLGAIGKTRWNSKSEALGTLLGYFKNWEDALINYLTKIDEIRTKSVFLTLYF